MEEKRRGRQEPTTRFTLPYQKTNGNEAIEFYQKSGREAQEWQRIIVYDMLAVNDSGEWVHSRFGFSVPRQNGKNECIAIREEYGLTHGERILHTAHRTKTSRAAWERLISLLEKSGIHEIKGEVTSGYKSGKSKGQEWVELDEEYGGGIVEFRTRSTTGGLGESYDCLVIDEAQEYQDDQESALKYTIAASSNPQTVYLGTPPTPYSSGTKFVEYRKGVLSGKVKHAGWAEWSVEEQTDVHDVDAWYETNPSLGYKISERTIEDEINDDVIDFNVQRLGLWIRYNQKSAISETEWNNLEVNRLPKLVGRLCIGIKFSKDGSSVSASIAAMTDTDEFFVETIGCKSMREGVSWLVSFIKKVGPNACKVVCDGVNGAELLSSAMKEEKLKQAAFPTVREIIDANALFEQNLFAKTIKHMNQPSVLQVISNCEKRAIGSAGGFGYKSTNSSFDISIMDSIILAIWGLSVFGKKKVKKYVDY